LLLPLRDNSRRNGNYEQRRPISYFSFYFGLFLSFASDERSDQLAVKRENTCTRGPFMSVISSSLSFIS